MDRLCDCYFANDSGAKYCQRVCLHVSKRVQTSQDSQYLLPVTKARSFSDDSAICYVLLPVLWMTACLPIVGYMAHG